MVVAIDRIGRNARSVMEVCEELEKRQGEKAEGKTDEEIYQEAVNAATGATLRRRIQLEEVDSVA